MPKSKMPIELPPRNWLKQKQFGQRVLQQCGSFNGQQLFKMSKKDCIAAFGKEEGTRLFSQVTISKNTNSFKTARCVTKLKPKPKLLK